ncbi:MAG: formate/nitrite transporter family protein [Solidesulfovibrio sp.]
MSFVPPVEVAKNCCGVQEGRVKLSIGKMIVLGLAAGFYISFGAEASVMVAHDLTSLGVGFQRFMLASIFSIGLMIVINGGAELFTGNCLLWVAYMDRKISTVAMLRSWAWVLLANMVGAVFFAWLYYNTGLANFNNSLLGAFQLKMAIAKTTTPWVQLFVRGIFCNWLVCLAVWLAFASGDVISKCLSAWIGVMTFVMSNFEHSIANMYYLPAGWFAKHAPGVVEASGLTADKVDALTWSSIVFNNWVPVTLGNIVGGVVFVASLYWFSYLRKSQSVPSVAVCMKKAVNE